MNIYRFDESTGRWVEAVPEPFWVRSWRALFRWRAACYECRTVFKTRLLHDVHWRLVHSSDAGEVRPVTDKDAPPCLN